MPSTPGEEVDCCRQCSSLPQSLSLVLVPVSLPISNRPPDDIRVTGAFATGRPSSSNKMGLAWWWLFGDMDLDFAAIRCRLEAWSTGARSLCVDGSSCCCCMPDAASSPNLEESREKVVIDWCWGWLMRYCFDECHFVKEENLCQRNLVFFVVWCGQLYLWVRCLPVPAVFEL